VSLGGWNQKAKAQNDEGARKDREDEKKLLHKY